MKKLQLKKNEEWMLLNPFTFTEAHINILKSDDEAAKAALLAEVAVVDPIVADDADKAIAQSKYDEIKPELKDGDVYDLIGMNCLLISNEVSTGILNYRLNGKQHQVRF